MTGANGTANSSGQPHHERRLLAVLATNQHSLVWPFAQSQAPVTHQHGTLTPMALREDGACSTACHQVPHN